MFYPFLWNHSSTLQCHKRMFIFVLCPCSKSHFRLLNCVSHGTVQGTHPTPLVVKQVLAVGSLCAQHCAEYHRVMGLYPPLTPSSTLCCAPPFLHRSPFPQAPPLQLPSAFSLCLSRSLPFISPELLALFWLSLLTQEGCSWKFFSFP